MNDDIMRAGANPATPAPTAQTSPLPLAAVNRAVGVAVTQLEDNLVSTAQLLALCTQLSCEPGAAGLSAMKTAARLLRCRSDSAAALARVACGESRHRIIVEFADAPEARLNSKFFAEPPQPAPANPAPANPTPQTAPRARRKTRK